MSDDLVKRLRNEKMGCNLWCEYYDGITTIPLCIEAADRIEKLEMTARGVPIRDMTALSKALDRIEKLEAALRTIYKCCDETGNCSVVRRIASKALETDNDRQ